MIDVPNVEPPPEPQYEALHEAIVRRRIARQAQRQQRRQEKRENRQRFDTVHRRSSGSGEGINGSGGGSHGDFSRGDGGGYNSSSNDLYQRQEVDALNTATRQAVRQSSGGRRTFHAYYRTTSGGFNK